MAIFACNNSGTTTVITVPSGWITTRNTGYSVVFWKKAVGTEGGTTINVTTNNAEESTTQIYRITGWYHDDSTPLNSVDAFSVTGSSTTPDPPSLNPANWVTEDTLWIAVAQFISTTPSVSSYPSNYTNGTAQVSSANGAAGSTMASARRELAANSEDPGTFVLSSTVAWEAITIAIRPGIAIPINYSGFEETNEFGSFVFDFVKTLRLNPSEETGEFGSFLLSGVPFRWSIEHLEARTDYGFPAVYVELSKMTQPTGTFPTGQFFERRILEVPRLEEAELSSRFGIAGFQRVSLVVDNSDGLFNSLNMQDAYTRMFFIDADGNTTREFKGRVTDWTLSHRATLNFEDIDTIAITQDLPKRSLNELVEAEKIADGTFASVVVANDLGKPIPIIFGRAIKVSLLYVKADETNRLYDYIIGEGEGLNGNNFQTVFTVYRNDQALDNIEGTMAAATSTTLTLESADQRPDSWYKYWWVEMLTGNAAGQITNITAYDSALNKLTVATWGITPTSGIYRLREWRFYNGSQASPYDGYAFIRFKKRMGVSGSTDPLYADVNGFSAETNPVRAIQSLLSNPNWGLGLDVDTASFNTAAGLSAVSAMLCEGPIIDTVAAVDVFTELLGFRDMVLSKDDQIQISVDQAKVSAHSFGLGDETGWNNILTTSPEIVHIHPNEKVKNLKIRYRKNNKENDVYLHELERSSSTNGVDTVINLPFVYEHVTADRWLDYKRKRFAAAIKRLAIDAGQEGGDVARGELASIHILTLGLVNSPWEITGAGVTPAGANSLSLVPYSASPYTYVPITDEGGTLPVDESFDIPPDYTSSIPDPVSGVAVTMSMGIVGFTASPFALLTWTPPEDNYSGAVVSVKLHADATTLFRAVGTYTTSARIEGLIPGQLYDFLIESLNVTGQFKGLGVLVNNAGAGYIAGGDSTAPATPTGLAGAAKFGKLIWTWNKNTEVDVSHYIIEIYTSTSGGSLVARDIVPHENNVSFTPRYELEIQTGDLTTSITRALRVSAVDHSGNVSAFTTRIAASTASVKQPDIGSGEITNKQSQTNPATTTTNGIINSVSITLVSGDATVDFDMSFRLVNACGLIVTIKRDANIIYGPSSSGLIQPGHFHIKMTDNPGAGTYTYGFQVGNNAGIADRILTVEERKR